MAPSSGSSLAYCEKVVVDTIPFVLQGVEHALAQQRKPSSAVPHSLEEFQLVHFSFDETVILGERESCCFSPGS